MTRVRRTVAGLALGASLIGAHGAQAGTCREDMPCWDCSSMGNRVCGVAPMPPRNVVRAMREGYSCWLETKYRIRGGNVYAYASEWLCR